MAILQRDGVGISYEVHGSGRPVVLSHGWAASARMWDPQVPALAAGHQVVTWDLRGHGASDSPADPAAYSHELALDDLGAVLDAVGAERAVLGGHSLGGYLSLAFAIRFPERVEALLLLGTGPGFRDPSAREEWNRMAAGHAATIEGGGLDAVPGDPALHGGAHRSAYGLAAAARGIVVQHGGTVIEGLPTIDVPALVLVGDRDKPFLGAADYLARKLPQATKVVIPDGGHTVNIKGADRVNDALLAFLAGL